MKRARRDSNSNRTYKKFKPTQAPPIAPNMRFQAKPGIVVEKKNIDVAADITPAINTSAWVAAPTLLNPIAQGATATNRIGRKIRMSKFQLRWSAQMDPGSAFGGNLRFKVVFDKQSNGAAAPILSVFTTDDFLSMNNLDNTDRFVTLCDVITDPIDSDGPSTQAGVVNVPISLESMFTGAAGAIANILTGSVYIFVSQVGTIPTASPTLSIYSRIRFSDV